MFGEKDRKQSELPQAAAEDAEMAKDRRAQWAKYDAMMSSVRAACVRHLAIIRKEQARADEELTARRRTGAGQ